MTWLATRRAISAPFGPPRYAPAMATLLAHIRVPPGKEVQFERIAEELYRATHEREADVRRDEYWRGAEPSTYYALESFDDLAGFVAHQTSEHHEAAPTAGSDARRGAAVATGQVEAVVRASSRPRLSSRLAVPSSREAAVSRSSRKAPCSV